MNKVFNLGCISILLSFCPLGIIALMRILIALGVATVLTIVISILLCRRRIARKMKVGVSTTLLGTLIPAACVSVLIYFFESEAFPSHHGFALIQAIFINAAAVFFIPALLTAIIYQTRNKEIHDA